MASRIFDEKFLSPLLSWEDLQIIFGFGRPEAEAIVQLFDGTKTGRVNAYEIMSIVYITGELPLLESCKKIFMLYGQ